MSGQQGSPTLNERQVKCLTVGSKMMAITHDNGTLQRNQQTDSLSTGR